MKKIALVFDCFGVLIHTVSTSWAEEKPDFEEKKGELFKIFREGDLGNLNMDEVMERVAKLFNDDKDNVLSGWNRYAKPLELANHLAELKEKYGIFLLSNAQSDFLKPILKKYDLIKYFDGIVISYDVRYAKPDKEIFDIMINMTKDYEKALFFDDNMENVNASNRAGLKAFVYKDYDSFIKLLEKQNIR